METSKSCPALRARHCNRRNRRNRPGRQRGVTALMFVMIVVGLFVFSGMALDLAQVYHRRQELDVAARTVALAAANQLNGKAAGVEAAVLQAETAIKNLSYQYERHAYTWSEQMLSFGATPDGVWLGAAAARQAPAGLLFVRTDTGMLATAAGSVNLHVMGMLSPTLTAITVSATAVAGRTGIDVVPLAICALSGAPGAARANPGPPATVELVEYGFRRGVAYDLMQLNPHGTAPVNYLIHPLAAPGKTGAAAGLAPAVVGPYVCTGQLGITSVRGGPLTVRHPFPLAELYRQLNARFDDYQNGLCSSSTAIVDRNTKSYVYHEAATWMTAVPDGQGALATTADGKLRTIADLLPAPAATQARMYGPLWAYARAVPFSAWSPGVDEPATGYPTFGPADWASLYAPGAPVAKNYPATTPYLATFGSYLQLPGNGQKGLANRRVLNVALLACPVPTGGPVGATVLGIGKFLMTVPATADKLTAEFGGLAPDHTLGGPVELVR